MSSENHDPDRKEFEALKERAHAAREAAATLEELAGGPLRHHYPLDLWSLSDDELDNEMGKRLGFLNEDIDCRPVAVTSHRRLVGPLIVLGKKILLKLLSPYTNSLFARQTRFHEQLVAFHLATFIRLRRIEERLKRLEGGLHGLAADAPKADRPQHE